MSKEVIEYYQFGDIVTKLNTYPRQLGAVLDVRRNNGNGHHIVVLNRATLKTTVASPSEFEIIGKSKLSVLPHKI